MKLLIAVLSGLLPFVAQAAEAQNLVENPSFEELDANGKPAGWNLPEGYAVTDAEARTGARSLTYTNTDKEVYRLASRPIPLEPGRRYEVTGWVRTQDVQGNDSGATLCIEFYQGETYRGGTYPAGVKGTQETWQEVRGISGPVPEGCDRYSVTCYLRREMTGTAWFDDIAVRPYVPPLVGSVVTDVYRNVIATGPFAVHAYLTLRDHQVTPEQASATLRILNAEGQAVQSLPGKLSVDQASWELDAATLPVGQLTLEVTAQAGESTGTATTVLNRVAQTPERKAWIDRDRRLILDGEPFFPLGTYWGRVTPEDVETYAESPFNCLMPYGGASDEMLDLLQSKDLKIIYTVKDLYAAIRKDLVTEADERAAIEKVVAEKKNHPAIMAWYINDELPISMLDRLTAHRDWMEELDPGRPTWVVLYQINEIRSYLPTFDVIGTDPYPIPTRPPSTALDYARRTFDACYGTRAVWQVPQIFDWQAYHEDRPHRAPTYDEMRSMAWSSIAGGANGLVFYSWFDLHKVAKKDPTQPFAERWAEICRFAQQIKDHIPVLLSVEPAPAYTVAGPDDVACRVWRKDGQVWLLAVNAGTEPAEATVTFDQSFKSAVNDLPEPDGTVQVAGQKVALTFKGLGVQMVRLTP